MNTNIFYLDNSIFGNPKFSSKVNALFRVFTPIITVLYLAFVIYLIVMKNDFTKIPYLVHAVIFTSLILFQLVVFIMYGRKFLKCNENSLTLKHKYFEKSISIPWQNIRSIQFSGSNFIIKISDSILEEVKFKAPIETYLDIRKYLKDQAGHLTKFEE